MIQRDGVGYRPRLQAIQSGGMAVGRRWRTKASSCYSRAFFVLRKGRTGGERGGLPKTANKWRVARTNANEPARNRPVSCGRRGRMGRPEGAVPCSSLSFLGGGRKRPAAARRRKRPAAAKTVGFPNTLLTYTSYTITATISSSSN